MTNQTKCIIRISAWTIVIIGLVISGYFWVVLGWIVRVISVS